MFQNQVDIYIIDNIMQYVFTGEMFSVFNLSFLLLNEFI